MDGRGFPHVEVKQASRSDETLQTASGLGAKAGTFATSFDTRPIDTYECARGLGGVCVRACVVASLACLRRWISFFGPTDFAGPH